MRRITLAIAAIALSLCATETVFAQDILNALYSSRPIANWTGPYIGGNVGYGWGKLETDASGFATPPAASPAMKGILGGLQTGANMQSGIWVFGVEADIQASSQKSDSLTTVLGFPITDNAKMPWFGTARLRAGIAADGFLVYGTGGLAFGEYRRTMQFVGVSNAFLNHSTMQIGWAAGGGIEGMISKNWGWRAEYLHVHFGNFNEDFVVTLNGVVVGTNTMNTRVTNDILRFGLNYYLR